MPCNIPEERTSELQPDGSLVPPNLTVRPVVEKFSVFYGTRCLASCRFYKNQPFFLIQNQMNPIRAFPSYLFKIHFNIIHPSTLSFSFRLFQQCPVRFFFSLPCLSISSSLGRSPGENNESRSSSLCTFLRLSVSSPFYAQHLLHLHSKEYVQGSVYHFVT